MGNIKAPIIVNLICSEDCDVKVKAMCLLRTMALTNFKPKFSKTLEAVVEPLTALINGSTVAEVLHGRHGVSNTLAIVCQVYPMLSYAEFKLVIDSFIKLINYESSKVPPYECLGIVYLCHGRKGMIVEKITLVLSLIVLLRLLGCIIIRISV